MYTILQKLDNIERALHHYDETRHVSLDNISYRSATVSQMNVQQFMDLILNFLQSFNHLLWQDGDRNMSFSLNELSISLRCNGREPNFYMNASRKKSDDRRCNVSDSILIPQDLNDMNEENMKGMVVTIVKTIYKLYPDDKERLQAEVDRLSVW